MASPSSRRSSFSKKARNSIFAGYLLAGLGALAGLILLGLSFWQPRAMAPARGAVTNVVAPAGEASAAVRTGSQGFFEAVSGFWRAGKQNAKLRRGNEIARIRLAEAQALEEENRQLKTLLALARGEIEPVASTRLVGSSASSARRFAYVSVGSDAGIRVGMPVRSPRGVVGRVLEVASGSARILLLTDSESVVPVRRASDETAAFVEGRGDGLLRVRLINLGINPLKKGDLLVTSGIGGYYRPGVAVAIMEEISSDGGLARLVADPSATQYVSIEPVYEPIAVKAARTPAEEPISDDAGAQELNGSGQ